MNAPAHVPDVCERGHYLSMGRCIACEKAAKSHKGVAAKAKLAANRAKCAAMRTAKMIRVQTCESCGRPTHKGACDTAEARREKSRERMRKSRGTTATDPIVSRCVLHLDEVNPCPRCAKAHAENAKALAAETPWHTLPRSVRHEPTPEMIEQHRRMFAHNATLPPIKSEDHR